MKGYAIPCGMPWHLADDVYGTVNSNPKFHCVLVVVALKERCIKCMIPCHQIGLIENYIPRFKRWLQCCQTTLSWVRFLRKMSEPTSQFLNVTKEITNLTHSKSVMLLVLPNRKALVCKYQILFCLTTIEMWCYYIFWLMIYHAEIVEFLLLHTLSIWVMDYKYHHVKLVLTPFAWDMLHSYGIMGF